MAGDDTPLMQQWRAAKSRHPDSLLFIRVGDFYELFHSDAEEGARLLGLTLTFRNNGAAAKVPLAGVPVKALDDYLSKLVRLGRRVAICDQVEDPALATGIVKREVTETVTPGTVLADNLLTARKNNFLVALLKPSADVFALAALDVSTGEFTAQVVPAHELRAELGRIEPTELLLPRSLEQAEELDAAAPVVPRTVRDDWMFEADVATDELLRVYRLQSLDGFGFEPGDEPLIRATGALVHYLKEVRPGGVTHLQPPRLRRPGSVMLLDEMTRRNLELIEPLRGGEEGGTLLDVLDLSVTAMGGRLLRRWILEPLVLPDEIWRRQDAVRDFVEHPELREQLRNALSDVTDLERLAGKIGTGRVAPRDLLGLRRSLERLPAIRALGAEADAAMVTDVCGELDCLEEVHDLLGRAISDEPPATLQDGGVIRQGWSDELDNLRSVRDGARQFIASLQVRERERTGISTLKVGFNKVFGYYLEVSKANTAKVPADYVRKQTLTNAERYFTPELKEWEEKVFGAEDRIIQLETELFAEVRSRVGGVVTRLQDSGARLATADVLCTFAEVATRQGYVRPIVHTGFDLAVRGSRHPVVETMMPREEFIPNDLVLTDEGWIVVLTGPNMAGKSTLLRQIGLIQLLAQIGSFVPADAANLPVTDRIFTRVGASDNLARGQSTFMVEMSETASIVHGATDRSLVLLDEIGRGTSTYDGVSIAWSVTEHLHEKIGAKTIFATHYHELTQLGDLLEGVKNMNVSVREVGDDIVFLRRLMDGGADRSYGIQVARLAGLPDGIVERARELLEELEGTHTSGGEGLGRYGVHRPGSEAPLDQLSMFQVEHPLMRRLRALDPDNLTPKEALALLYELRKDATGGDD
ncbi:MAG TPA: DNA mismatch repair protein MutS [Gemmatimonadetes bacterium]|nr:DNA mismatch repair protein MutS [Gemmatimonadota bacterium]HBD97304.1 DNA mismatch repair protein MutS [Gemmatimonadota bacterium]HIN52459.1 DNA mismatch repair protein MutS [Gemmatimonadota bacterium]